MAIQDTTELDFTGKRSSDNLGVLEYAHRHGIYLHNQLLVSGTGIPLGLFSQKFHHRKADDLGKSRAKRYAPVEEKESYKWVEAFNDLQDTFGTDRHLEIISVCDREADMYEMLCAQLVEINSASEKFCRKMDMKNLALVCVPQTCKVALAVCVPQTAAQQE